MVSSGKAENFIENTSGCGPFQIVMTFVVVALNMATVSYTVVFMSFGNYNPGWRCLDNVTNANASISPIDPLDVTYSAGSCDDYSQCQQIEFNPETSTIVTEWGLLCDKSWMTSLTISLQMVGMLIFSFLVGQIADTFGRKRTLYGGLVICGGLQLLSAFSVSWGMLVVLLFFISGVTIANMLVVYIYASEFMTIKWRTIVAILPFWYVGTGVQAVTSMITKDWRHIQLFGFALHVICFIPVFWVPESLRWLEVKGKTKPFNSVIQKIAGLNKTVVNDTLEDDDFVDSVKENKERVKDGGKKYTIIDLFRHGYLVITICLGFSTLIMSMIFYAMIFGTKSLYGNFYVNLIVLNVTAIPVFCACIVPIHYVSRKRITYVLLGVAAFFVFLATGLLFTSSETAKSIGSTTFLAIGRAIMDAVWSCMYARTAEIYPTVVRGIGIGYSSVTARVGGIIAPFIIPTGADNLYVFTIICGVLMVLLCLLNVFLPETKGKPLKESFDDHLHEVELVQEPINTLSSHDKCMKNGNSGNRV